MAKYPLFQGLIVDESDNPVDVTFVGGEACYVVNDAGFLRHISSEYVDRQVLQKMEEMIEGHEDLISDQAAKMLGQDDIFSRAMIAAQLKQIDQQFDALLETGLPEEARAYMGMLGFRVKIDVHGEVTDLDQPGMIEPGEDE
jgi:hypothetical protein